MIARMSKYDLVLFAAQSGDFIDRLRDLGSQGEDYHDNDSSNYNDNLHFRFQRGGAVLAYFGIYVSVIS